MAAQHLSPYDERLSRHTGTGRSVDIETGWSAAPRHPAPVDRDPAGAVRGTGVAAHPA